MKKKSQNHPSHSIRYSLWKWVINTHSFLFFSSYVTNLGLHLTFNSILNLLFYPTGEYILTKSRILSPHPLKICVNFLPCRGKFFAPHVQFFSVFFLQVAILCHQVKQFYHILSHYASLTLIIICNLKLFSKLFSSTYFF